MAETTDPITRDELVRAINATLRQLDERATGNEALAALRNEIESPHVHEALYTLSDGGPCGTCGDWVRA